MIRIEEIRFSHRSNADRGEALNIRLSHKDGTVVHPPEWRRGYLAQPVAYARLAAKKTLTIRARFSGGPSFGSLRVRAMDDSQGYWEWLKALVGWFFRLLGVPPLGVLGDVRERIVTFDADGESRLLEFRLANHRIAKRGVGTYFVSWRWQYKRRSTWITFGSTEHRVYVVVDIPFAPWYQNCPNGEHQDCSSLPWVTALDIACSWARGAKTKEAAAQLIADAFNASPLISYASQSVFVSAWDSCLLSSLLHLLRLGIPVVANCSDCASTIVALSNLLGCKLFAGRMDPTFKGNDNSIDTHEVVLIGGNPSKESDWETQNFGYHEVAWWEKVTEDGYVYDACLQLDLRERRRTSAHRPTVAAHMKFQGDTRSTYSHYVLQKPVRLNHDPPRRAVQ
jgi:hypothetical protein